MMKRHDGRIIFIGPLLTEQEDLPTDFENTVPAILEDWHRDAAPSLDLRYVCGSWRTPGSPPVVLVDFEPLYAQKATRGTATMTRPRSSALPQPKRCTACANTSAPKTNRP